jgi:hypothetical protein
MGLKEQQDLLARLYTDTEFSKAFFEDPSVAFDKTFSSDEANEIAAVASDEIKLFANSLISKRMREVEKLLPLTCRYLEKELKPEFREFAQTFNPTSTKKHLEDAIRFGAFIGKSSSVRPCIRDIARFESAALEHFSRGRRLTICRIGYDLRPLIRSKNAVEVSDLRRRRSRAVWFRIGAGTRFFFL